jgi:UDP-N-acetyl-D-mannosaminuronic acid dehydrogenase
MKNSTNIAIFGLGRVGLPLALSLAEAGFTIYGIEKSKVKNEMIGKGVMPFQEAGAELLLKKHIGKKLIINLGNKRSLQKCDAAILCVGTTVDEYLNPIIDDLFTTLREILPFLKKGSILITRSTLTPGSSKEVIKHIVNKTGFKIGKELFYAYVPERIAEGAALKEIRTIPSIIGVEDEQSGDRAQRIFGRISQKTFVTDTLTAEIAKLSLNTYRYITFATANELAMIASHYGRDIHHILKLANADYVRGGIPDPGFAAGPCLYKDGFFLKHGTPYNSLITASLEINEGLPAYLVSQIRMLKPLQGLKAALLGLAYKKNVDDPRDSLAFKVKKLLKSHRARVASHDPFIQSNKLERVLRNSDLVFVTTNHDHYKEFGLSSIKSLAKQDAIVCDVWNLFGTGKILFPLSSVAK